MLNCRCVPTMAFNTGSYFSGLWYLLQQCRTCPSLYRLPTLGGTPIHPVYCFPNNTTDEIVLWMAYGDLDQFYSGGGSGLPFQGVCQGNGTGPAIWLAMSIVLMNMVWSNSHKVSLFSPISYRPTDLLGLLYMDHCNLFAIDNDGCHPHTTIANLQQNINLWQGGLVVTGGSLSSKK